MFIPTNDEKKSNIDGGISLSTVLVIVFVILKLSNNIDWSWWWVFSPYWIPIVLVLSVFIIVLFISLLYVAHTGKSIDDLTKNIQKSNKLLKP
jgi:hypothetical protein